MNITHAHHEKACWLEGRPICGIDEVGRGCLAGPVVAAAVMLRPGKTSKLVKDSKLLSEKQLLAAYAWIIKNGWIGIGIMGPDIIDRVNIYRATIYAMQRAFWHLSAIAPKTPEMVLVDAMPLELSMTEVRHTVQSFARAERESISVAAASIVAKVTRDRLLNDLNRALPGYNFESHKGYGTARHQEALVLLGRSIIHRDSFLSFLTECEDEQLELW